MDLEYAKKVLRVLADGVNPTTGEVLPDSDSSNQVEIVRAIHTVLDALASTKQKKTAPANAGKPWTEEDDKILCKMYDENCSVESICEYFKRSPGGIAARLVHVGKIQNREELQEKMG